MTATVKVVRAVAIIGGKEVPVIPDADPQFPWRAWCLVCDWFVHMGGWRDTFDFGFFHAKGHAPEEKSATINPQYTIRKGVIDTAVWCNKCDKSIANQASVDSVLMVIEAHEEEEHDKPLAWHIGIPNATGAYMFCNDCGKEVWSFDGGYICSGCGRQEAPAQEEDHITTYGRWGTQ